MFNAEDLVRENIKNLKPYSSARDEFQGQAQVYLDANENSFGSPVGENYNRYPDPLQGQLKKAISRVKGMPAQNIFLGNGSDEAIDLAFRIFCEPGKDNVIICPPTYGMYQVSAEINNVALKKVPLLPSFDLDVPAILEAVDERTKLLFVCSPNNPTGNSVHPHDLELLLQKFKGVVVVDEAYINYSRQASFIHLLPEYANLLVLQTFSKAWGLASLRLGMAFASEQIVDYFNKVKPPYNVNGATQQLALQAIDNMPWVNERIKLAVQERNKLATLLQQLPAILKVYASDANFLLVQVANARHLYTYLVGKGIIVRDRSNVTLCDNCLRITIGTAHENILLLNAIQEYSL